MSVQGQINFSLYPNPTNGLFTIKLGSFPAEKFSIRIVDVSGKLVSIQEFEPTQLVEIDISDKAKGIYLMKLSIGDKAGLTRILKCD